MLHCTISCLNLYFSSFLYDFCFLHLIYLKNIKNLRLYYRSNYTKIPKSPKFLQVLFYYRFKTIRKITIRHLTLNLERSIQHPTWTMGEQSPTNKNENRFSTTFYFFIMISTSNSTFNYRFGYYCYVCVIDNSL